MKRREVYLVLKELSDGRVLYVEGLKSARNYFFDGHSRVTLDAGNKATFETFSPENRPMQLFHMPKESHGKWQAAYHDFGCWPEFGEPEGEYVIFVGAYSNDRERVFELMREGMERAYQIINEERDLRDGEFPD